jgi:hypothetical protein
VPERGLGGAVVPAAARLGATRGVDRLGAHAPSSPQARGSVEGVGDGVPAAGRGEVVAGVVGFGAVVHFPGAVQPDRSGMLLVAFAEPVGQGLVVEPVPL